MNNNNKKEKISSKQIKKQKSFLNVLEGREAINALAEALDADGLLVDNEKNTKDLKSRITKLEHEIEVIKSLLAKAIHLNGLDSSVLKG